MPNSTTKLRRLLETLPQELYDEIYILTFTAQPAKRQIGFRYHYPSLLDIDVRCAGPQRTTPRRGASSHTASRRTTRLLDSSKRYNFPDSINLFLVDRASSERFAASYFGGPGAVFCFDSFACLDSWLGRLSKAHRGMVRQIEYKGSRQEGYVKAFVATMYGQGMSEKVRFVD